MSNPFESHLEDDILLTDAFKKAQELEDPVKMQDFTNNRDLEHDLQYVADMELKFKESEARDTQVEAMLRKMAKVFEMIVYEQIELSNWLGESAMTQQASKYDDYRNGVDSIVELDVDEGVTHLALAIDVTSSHELQRKFDRIKDEIDRGILTNVKYFVSEALGFKGEKRNIPRVVIGADRKTIIDLVEKWMEEDKDALEMHVVQAIVVEEIIAQLEAFKQYAESIGRPDVAKVYERTLAILAKIKLDKDLPEQMIDDAHDDQVLAAINNNLLGFKQTK